MVRYKIMEPEHREPPPAPPPPPPQPEGVTGNVPITEGRRNHSFSWSSSSSSSTSSFNSLVDSFKKNDEPQQPTSPQLSGEDQMGASSSRRNGYDPSRIPSSIFSKPSNQTDWSVASNESLFSINTGSNSFSLGEFMLPNYEPTNIYPLDQPTNNPFRLSITSEAEDEGEYGRKSSSIWEDFQETKEPAVIIAITEPPEIVVTKKEESQSERILLESCSNVSEVRRSFSGGSARMSEESGNSCSSFAFPLLTSEVATTNELSQAPAASKGTTDHERPQPALSPKRESNEKERAGPETTPERGTSGSESPPENNSSWFSYFSCCSLNCLCCGRARCSNANTNEKLDT